MAGLPHQQLCMTALLDNLAPIQHHDPVGVPYRREAMGDDDDRAPLADRFHVVLDDALRLVVQGAGGFIENQDARVADQRPGDGDALALVAGESRTVFADERVVAFRQFEKRPITSPASMTRSIPRRISGESGR